MADGGLPVKSLLMGAAIEVPRLIRGIRAPEGDGPFRSQAGRLLHAPGLIFMTALVQGLYLRYPGPAQTSWIG